jgi:hypothetical protein
VGYDSMKHVALAGHMNPWVLLMSETDGNFWAEVVCHLCELTNIFNRCKMKVVYCVVFGIGQC